MEKQLKKNWKKRFSLLVAGISILFLIACGNSSYAAELDVQNITSNDTLYQRWSNLSENEKKNYIEPLIQRPIYQKETNNYATTLRARAASIPKYNLKDQINITVKNQQNTNSCWAFSHTSVIESNISRTTGKTSPLFSPRHIEMTTAKTFKNGATNPAGFNRQVDDGGNAYLAFAYDTSGKGPVLEKDMPFVNSAEKVNASDLQGKKAAKKVESFSILPSIDKKITNGTVEYLDANGKPYTQTQVNEIRQMIKEHIMNYGALSAYTCGSSAQYYSNPSNPITSKAYYCSNSSALVDHQITIVGWDDTYSKDNFNPDYKPVHDGAYIIQNSYGTEAFDNGYLYVSYDDVLIESCLIGAKETTNVDYTNIYQHDPYGCNYSLTPAANGKALKSFYAGNVFERNQDGNEYVQEIGIASMENMQAEVYINTKTGSLLISEASKVTSTPIQLEPGYQTIKLSKPMKIEKNQFSVIVKYTSSTAASAGVEMNYKSNGAGSNFWDVATSHSGESMLSADGTNWQDLNTILQDSNFTIKALTINDIDESPVVTFSPNGNTTYLKEQKVTIHVTDDKGIDATSLKYRWTQDTNKPAENTFTDTFTNGQTLTLKGKTGKNWYLWIYAKDNGGNTVITRSNPFYVDNTKPGMPTVKSSKDGNTVRIDITGSGAQSGILKYQYSTDKGNQWQDIKVGQYLTVSKPGTYSIWVRAVSKVGLTSDVMQYSVTVQETVTPDNNENTNNTDNTNTTKPDNNPNDNKENTNTTQPDNNNNPKPDNNQNNNNNNGNQNNSNNNQKPNTDKNVQVEKEQLKPVVDKTTSNTMLPQTGENNIAVFIIAGVIIAAVVVFAYTKYSKLDDEIRNQKEDKKEE